MRRAWLVLALTLSLTPLTVGRASAQVDPHQHHRHQAPADTMAPAGSVSPAGSAAPAGSAVPAGIDHSAHTHDLGPAGSTYDLRWIDAMVQHHTGALRMSEVVFDIGEPGLGALAKEIWRDQAQEIKVMGRWRKAWYPQAPLYPVVLRPGGDPDAMADLIRMGPGQIEAMRMMATPPSPNNRVTWFLEGMLQHHGGALVMAHEALQKSRNPRLRRLARDIIVAQRGEILQLRRMLRHSGSDKPEYDQFDRLFFLK